MLKKKIFVYEDEKMNETNDILIFRSWGNTSSW